MAASTAVANPCPTRSGRCASEPNDTRSPPLSAHQPTITGASGTFVLISSARPDAASARSTVRSSSSKSAGRNGPAAAGQYRTAKSMCARTWNGAGDSTSANTSAR